MSDAAGLAYAEALAACPHFGACGGCIDLAPKQDRLPAALLAAGFTALPDVPLFSCLPGTRRRMDLAVRRVPALAGQAGAELGLHRHRSHDIVDLHSCTVLHPALVALFAPLREILARCDLLRRGGDAIANVLDDGIDLLLRSDGAASTADRARLAGFAASHGVARVSHARGGGVPETLAMAHRPSLMLSGVRVHPPPGTFLQATASGEAAIVAAVLAGLPEHLTRRSRIVELFAGIGTLTYALARRAVVAAYEGDAAAFGALEAACRGAGLIGRVRPEARDLARRPVMAAELAGCAVVVLDPPAGGALAQVREIAAAAVARVVYVSCAPATLARDAAVLRGAGYRLLAGTAIDQFIGAARVESVCVFALG